MESVRGKVKVKKMIVWILLVLLVIFVILNAVMYVLQDRLIFYYVDDPESRMYLEGKPGYEKVEFTAENGKTYHGMMYHASSERAPLLIYFGGNGECSYRKFRNLEAQNQWKYYAECNFLYVDYDGYGLNGGQLSCLKMYEHSLAVYDYALTLSNVDKGRIAVMGYSL